MLYNINLPRINGMNNIVIKSRSAIIVGDEGPFTVSNISLSKSTESYKGILLNENREILDK